MIINDNKRIEMSGAWSALTPALSPRRGGIIVSRSVKRALFKISRGVLCCYLSPGERVRVRASVPVHFGLRISDFGFYV